MKRSSSERKGRLAGAERARSAEQIQDRHHREHSARRKDLALSQRRFHRSLRRAARHAHRKHRRVQAHQRRQRLLQRRRKESAAPAYLRHRVQNEKGTRRLFRHARGSEEARPSQARQGTGDLHHRRRCRPGFAAVAAARRRDRSKNSRSSRKKPSSPPVINAFALRTSRAKALYKKSGHLPYYAESMFPPMELHEDRGAHAPSRAVSGASPETSEETSARAPKSAREARAAPQTIAVYAADRYYLKAMNCPHHHKLFAAVPRSYRDLPLRLAEYGTCYRYEQSGELFGLMRVRSMQMNDAHHLLHARAVRSGVQCRERDVSEIFQALRDRQISDAFLDARSVQAWAKICR